MLPYFKRSEGNKRGGDALHGGHGPLSVSDLRYTNPLSQVFIEAGQQAGYARNRDFNGPSQEGVGLYQVTQRDGARCSAAVAYLDPVQERPEPHHRHRRAGQPHHLRRPAGAQRRGLLCTAAGAFH